MPRPPRPFAHVEPSREIDAARWLVDRLTDERRGPFPVSNVVPRGFPAYVRIDHPDGHEGGLVDRDARALAAVLAAHTSTPQRCWFCLWVGYGGLVPGPGDVAGARAWLRRRYDRWWGGSTAGSVYVVGGGRGLRGRLARTRARLRLQRTYRRYLRRTFAVTTRCGVVDAPWRQYLLFRGPAAAVRSAAADGGVPFPWRAAADPEGVGAGLDGPNLWWADDRAWVVASEIDLAWTYVGGSEALAAALLADDRFRASRVTPTDPLVPSGDGTPA
ncbi:MAG TPA: hypothetical protein VFZ68_04190 [Acidimicrobiales bacterium]